MPQQLITGYVGGSRSDKLADYFTALLGKAIERGLGLGAFGGIIIWDKVWANSWHHLLGQCRHSRFRARIT